jgi:hypothetical protein
MITDILHRGYFGTGLSFLLGIALVMIVSPICRGKNCIIVKAPPIHEVRDYVYHIGTKCYKFDTVQMDCPASGAVEAFQNI